MNRGFHAFFRQYYNLRDLLRRIDPGLGLLTPVEDYPLVDGQGRRDTFRGLPQTPPLNALAFALRSPTFRLRDLARLNARAAAPLAAVSVPGIYERLDHVDADKFLRDINFPDAARHLAFEVFSRSFFAEPSDLSAAELATMFHIYFLGSSEGLIFDVATRTSMWRCGIHCGSIWIAGRAIPHRGIGRHGDHRRAPAGALRPPVPMSSGRCRAGDRRRGPSAHRRRLTRPGRRGLARAGRRTRAPHPRSWCNGYGWTGRCRPTGRRSSGPAGSAAGQCQRARAL